MVDRNWQNRHVIHRVGMRFIATFVCAIICLRLTGVACAQRRLANLAASLPPNAAPVAQFNGTQIQLPAKRPTSRTSGLTLSVDPRWTNGYGYRPVEVTIKSPKPAKADQLITIQLHTGWKSNISVEQLFELKQGSTQATTKMALPVYQAFTNNYFWWDVWVDGVKDKDLSVDRYSSMSWIGSSSGGGASLTFLAAGPATSHRTLVATNGMEFEALSLELAKFPTRWIDYTTLDVVALSLAEAQQLEQQQPATLEAICRWVRAGGQLWICDAGKELENLPAISKLLRLSDKVEPIDVATDSSNKMEIASGKDTEQATKDVAKSVDKKANEADFRPVVASWHPLRFRTRNSDGRVVTFMDTRSGARRTVRDPEMIDRLQQNPNFVTAEERFEPAAVTSDRKFAPDSGPWFLEQEFGLGAVQAFRGENEVTVFAQSPPTANPNAVVNSDAPDLFPSALAMGLRRVEHWDARHGMSPDSGNVEFAKFLVPGVGLAPVTEFEVLITVFVLVIGPLNYWLLQRFKRLHLMVLTVPLAAAITTAALFTYAIVADGFATRVRAHSYTTIDQRTGEAACWTRLSYYSGLAPGNGLTLPADTVVYPIQPSWIDEQKIFEERLLTWGEEEAELRRGWLNSRTPTQYLTVRARNSPHRLEVLESGDKLRVKNQLGANIEFLVVMSERGKLYFGENIADVSNAWLQRIERDDAIRRISRRISDNLPQAPAALASSDAELNAVIGRTRYGRYGRYGTYNSGRLSENMAGDALANLAGFGDRPALNLAPRSYVAITQTGPEVETGISYAQEEASFHLIEGKW